MRSQPTATAAGLASILPDAPAGSLALAAAVAATATQPPEPAAPIAEPDRAITFADYATLKFEPCFRMSDMNALRTTYDENWAPLAYATSLLAKDHDEMAAFVATMEEGIGPTVAADLLKTIDGAAEWFEQTANIMRSASFRLLAGMCRSFKAKGGSMGDENAPAPDRPIPAKHPDDALLDLNLRWIDIQAEWERPGDEGDVEMRERNARESEIVGAIAALPATTAAGLAVKARILAREADCEARDDAGILTWAAGQLQEHVWLNRIVGSLVIDLLRYAREAA